MLYTMAIMFIVSGDIKPFEDFDTRSGYVEYVKENMVPKNYEYSFSDTTKDGGLVIFLEPKE